MTQAFTVDVSGVSAELRPLAEKDIRKLASFVAVIAAKMELPFLLQEFRLTTQFVDDVNELLLKERDLSGYTALRDNVQAYGKTVRVHSQQEGLGFVILVDANLIGAWSLNNPWCLVVVLHELVHILLEARALKRLGEEKYTKKEYTRERLLDSLAESLIDEYDVDRWVDTIVKKICTKDDGQPCSLRELEEAKDLNWVGTLMTALEEMPQRIDDAVRRYKTRKINLSELSDRVVSNVKDLLILLSHTSAMYMGTESWPEIIERLGRTEASRRFLKEHVKTILDELADPRLPFEASVQALAHAIEEIFRCCGLRFENVPEGMYIGVDWPNR